MSTIVRKATNSDGPGILECLRVAFVHRSSFIVPADRQGHIRGMAVLPDEQGSGVAQRLLDAAEGEMRAWDCRRVTLDTTQPLERAIHFYERNGYRPTGVVADFFGMPLYQYRKELR